MVRSFPAAVFALALATALFPGAVSAAPASADTPSAPRPLPGPAPASTPGQGVVLSGFRMVQDSGPRRWEIVSREAAYDGENAAALQGVEARLLEQEVLTLTVSGLRGRYLSDSRTLTLEGKVRAHTLTGYDFSAATMEWRGGEALVAAAGGVTLTRSFLTVKGRSLTHRTDTGTTVMVGGITARWAGGSPE
jgi:hypothetical protein